MIDARHNRLMRVLAAVATALAVAVMSACGGDPDAPGAPGDAPVPEMVSVSTTPHANGAQAVRVDVVYAMTDAAARKLSDMSDETWFEKREQWQKKFGKAMRLSSWQVPPGIRDAMMPAPAGAEDAVAVWAFAALHAEGDHRVSLIGRRRAALLIEETRITLED